MYFLVNFNKSTPIHKLNCQCVYDKKSASDATLKDKFFLHFFFLFHLCLFVAVGVWTLSFSILFRIKCWSGKREWRGSGNWFNFWEFHEIVLMKHLLKSMKLKIGSKRISYFCMVHPELFDNIQRFMVNLTIHFNAEVFDVNEFYKWIRKKSIKTTGFKFLHGSTISRCFT